MVPTIRFLPVLIAILVALSLLPAGTAAHAQSAAASAPPGPSSLAAAEAESETDLAKKLQNPIGDLYSVPFQSNTNFNTGPHKGTQEILNIQPVLPIHISEDWNIITRTILPLIWQPSLQPAQTVPFGTGPTSFSAFLSPSQPANGWLWGIGPIGQVPTISDSTLGSNVWGAGPTGLVVYMKGPWSRVCLLTMYGLSAASRHQVARNTICFWCNRSQTTISAAAGTSARLRSSPPTGSPPATRHGPCRWAVRSAA